MCTDQPKKQHWVTFWSNPTLLIPLIEMDIFGFRSRKSGFESRREHQVTNRAGNRLNKGIKKEIVDESGYFQQGQESQKVQEKVTQKVTQGHFLRVGLLNLVTQIL